MPQLFLNNFHSAFMDPVAPGATQVRIVRTPGGQLDLQLSNDDFYLLTAFRIVNQREVDHEVMKVTAVVASSPGSYTLSVQRGREHVGQGSASTANAFGVGDHIEARWTAGAAGGMLQADDNLRTLTSPAAALQNLGAGTVGAAVLRAETEAEVRTLIGAGTGSGEGGGVVDVAANGSLIVGSTTVAPAYLGVRTASQIAAIHAAIAANTQSYPAGSILVTEAGAVLTLQGIGTAARFAAVSASGITIQPVKTGSYTLALSDDNTVIPVSGAATITVGTGLGDFNVQILRHDADALVVRASSASVSLWHGGVRVTSVTVTGKGDWLAVFPGSTANEFNILAYGVATSVAYSAGGAALSISGTPSTTAAVGSAYSFTPTAAGGVAPRTFALIAGALPAGLSFNTSTGAITGTPTASGAATGLTIRVTDAVQATAVLPAFTLTVSADARPIFFVGPATAHTTNTQTLMNAGTRFGTSGSKAGTVSVQTPTVEAQPGVYGWIAVPASASASGVTFTDISGIPGDWNGAGLPAQNGGASPVPAVSTVLFTHSNGVSMRLFRMDNFNSQPTASNWVLS
jgi:hypothetical protein